MVDDNHDAATMLDMLLELSGHTVRMAHDGRQAFQVAEQFRPDGRLAGRQGDHGFIGGTPIAGPPE